jgi:hypothetical protein
MILIFITGREKCAEQIRRVSMVRPVGPSRMDNLSLEQSNAWRMKIKYYEYVIDKNNRPVFGFVDASWGYGRIGMNDDTKI